MAVEYALYGSGSEQSLLSDLNVIRAHKRDCEWFFANEDHIRSAIQYGLNYKGPAIRIATEALFAALNNYRWHANYASWVPLVSQALLESDNSSRSVVYARLFLRFGAYLLHQGEHRTAARALDIASAILAEVADPSVHMERLLLLLRMQCMRSHQELTEHNLAYAELLQSEVHDPELTAELQLDFCHILLQQGGPEEVEQAGKLAKRAYALWRRVGVSASVCYAVLLRIKSARMAFRLRRADRLIRWLKPQVSGDAMRLMYAELLYEEGCTALQLGDVERAAACLGQAVGEFTHLKMVHHAAACQMSLSLPLIASRRFEAAESALESASKVWDERHYAVGQVRVKVYRAYSAIERLRLREAEHLLHEARGLLEGCADEKLCRSLLAEIEDMESRIIEKSHMGV